MPVRITSLSTFHPGGQPAFHLALPPRGSKLHGWTGPSICQVWTHAWYWPQASATCQNPDPIDQWMHSTLDRLVLNYSFTHDIEQLRTYRGWNSWCGLQQLLNCSAVDWNAKIIGSVACLIHRISRVYAIFIDVSLHICNESELIKLGIRY